jgi:16S rRNA (cytidine1402-2'-O)-methyltransferase
VIAYHEHNEVESAEGLIALLKQGQSVAVTSEAGAPGVSDPGFRVVQKAFENKIKVVSVPGASALTSALSVSPIGGKTFFFAGFLSSKSSQRKKEYEEYSKNSERLVIFESPHRLMESLSEARKILNPTSVSVFRELTKSHEEILHGSIDEVLQHFTQHPPRGEFVIIFAIDKKINLESDLDLRTQISKCLNEGLSVSETVKKLQNESTQPRKALYNLVLEISRSLKI